MPTIGIGAGPGCDGQIQVLHDILGLGSRLPRHAKHYADLNAVTLDALRTYKDEVSARSFPTADHTTEADDAVVAELPGEAG